MTGQEDDKPSGLAQAYVINTFRPFHVVRDLSRVPAIIDLIIKEKTGILQKENPLRRKPTWQQFVSEDQMDATIVKKSNKRGDFITSDPEEAYLCLDGLKHDKRVKLDDMSLPLPPRKRKPVMELISELLKKSGTYEHLKEFVDKALYAQQPAGAKK